MLHVVITACIKSDYWLAAQTFTMSVGFLLATDCSVMTSANQDKIGCNVSLGGADYSGESVQSAGLSETVLFRATSNILDTEKGCWITNSVGRWS